MTTEAKTCTIQFTPGEFCGKPATWQVLSQCALHGETSQACNDCAADFPHDDAMYCAEPGAAGLCGARIESFTMVRLDK